MAALLSGPGYLAGTGVEKATKSPGAVPAPGPGATPVPAVTGAAPVTPAPLAPPAPFPAFGAYLDYSWRGVVRTDWFSRWLGGAELRVGRTYLPGDLWSNVDHGVRAPAELVRLGSAQQAQYLAVVAGHAIGGGVQQHGGDVRLPLP
ncbi:hypothetical protein [Streptomyces pseudoechinosporeus]